MLWNTYGVEVINQPNHSILCTCVTNLGWFQGKQNKPFSNSWRQLAPNAHEFEEVTSSIQHMLHERNTKALLTRFPTLGWCSTWIMGETKCCWWAQQQLIGISISLDFHHYVNNVIVLVRPKDVMVYARGKTTSKTTLRISLVLIWFDDSPYSNQRLDKIIDPAIDHEDQPIKISSFFNTHA